MLAPVTLSVPVEPRYRTLAPELAAKYAELCGCGSRDAQSLADRVRLSIAAIAASASSDADLSVMFRVENGHVEVHLRTQGAASVSVVQCPVAVRSTSLP